MSNSGGGIGMVGLAWIALVVLKVLGYLSWNWLAVLLFPVWCPIVLAIVGVVAALAFVIVVGLIIGFITLITYPLWKWFS